jgi:signal transduction histidine kinase
MQQMEQAAGLGGAARKRVEAVVETLATLHGEGESLAEVAHDARNMVTALGLYCDLLEEPGVLSAPFLHYGSELRLLASASRRLVEKLVALDGRETSGPAAANAPQSDMARLSAESPAGDPQLRARRWDLMPAEPVGDLAREVMANKNLLSAVAGTAIVLTISVEGAARPSRLNCEDLTRVLVNLVKNAAEAMSGGGNIRLQLRERSAGPGSAAWLTLAVEDDGPGIPPAALDQIFEAGFTTRSKGSYENGVWQVAHRGLGLSIARSIVEAAGGRIHAENRTPAGARIEIELPACTR